jgi:hypothetical protein
MFASTTSYNMRQTQQQRDYDRDEDYDKDWARKYILDPLTAPEPSQESGIASSHNAAPRPISQSKFSPSSSPESSPPKRRSLFGNLSFRSKPKQPAALVSKSRSPAPSELPTPPTSASPSKTEFHPSNPVAMRIISR